MYHSTPAAAIASARVVDGLEQTEKPNVHQSDVTVNVTEHVTEKRRLRIRAEIQRNPRVTLPDLSSILGVTRRTIARDIATLKAAGRLRRVGPDKGGHWEVCG